MARRMQSIANMTRQVNEKARRRLRARFWAVLARYRNTQQRITEELESREVEEVENAVELWDSEVLSSVSDIDLTILADVLAALHRVAAGTYGRCVTCGDPIAVARLDAIPEAARCIGCARGAERRERRAVRRSA